MNSYSTLQQPSYQSAAIQPSDFYRTFDAQSGKGFDRGSLRHIRAALAGQPVAVLHRRELSKIGARLDGPATSRSGVSGELVTTAYRDSRTGDLVEQPTIMPWRNIAAIIPMATPGDTLSESVALTARHTAIRTYMDEASAAIEYAKSILDIESIKREQNIAWETWTARPGENTVSVTCWEQRGASLGRPLAHLEVTVADAAATLERRHAQLAAR